MNILQILGLAGQNQMGATGAGQPALDPRLPQATPLPVAAPQGASPGGLGAVLGGGQPQQWHGLGGYLKALLPGIANFAGGLAETGSVPGAFGVMRQNRQQGIDNALKMASLNQRSDNTPATVRELMAAGVNPGSPEFRRAILDHLQPPRFLTLGSPESGQTVVNTNDLGGGMGDVPTVSDQASYDAIPSGAHFRDPQGNVRQKP